RQHACAGLQGRDDVALGAVCEVRGVYEREGGWREQVALLGAPGRLPHERRGVPLGEEDREAFGLEPLVQERQLRGLAAAVRALDDEELAGEFVLAVMDHPCDSNVRVLRACNTMLMRPGASALHIR